VELLNSPFFGINLTIFSYLLGMAVYKKLKLPIFNPILVALTFISAILLTFKIPLEYFSKGGDIITIMLGPATVVLALPLYNKIHLLKENFLPIMGGIVAGVITTIISCYLLGKAFGLNETLVLSSLPKSITTPIGLSLSKDIGGHISITMVMIIITGITGAVISPTVCKIFKIKNPVAKGIAIGTASHAIGTSKAIEMGEEEGAMSSLAIGVAGIMTVIILPLLIKVLF